MNKILQGDALTVQKKLPNKSVNCCVTSPPYWGLRDYGIKPIIWDGNENCEHEWGNKIITLNHKSGETNPGKESWFKDKGASDDQGSQFCSKCGAWKGSLGLEPTFELYIKHLCDIFDETKRVLRDDGTLWVNLGDTYGGSGNASGHTDSTKNLGYTTSKMGASKGNQKATKGLEKSLCLIPFRFAIEMVNRGWILRNVIIWHKPNVMPSSVKDRFTVDFEYLFFFVKNKKYWFEQQFEEHTTLDDLDRRNKGRDRREFYGEQGRNKRTVWTIPTKPYPEAHFAVYPAELIRTCIKAGCPRYVCKKCGKAREKIYEKQIDFGVENSNTKYNGTDCGCNAGFRPGVVLDPFAGSGTTGEEAIRQGKEYILIEIKKEYLELIEKKLKRVQVNLI